MPRARDHALLSGARLAVTETSRRSRDDVIAAALEVVRANGLEAMTMQRVASVLQRGRTSVYHHFPRGLPELQAAVVERAAELSETTPPSGEDATPVERIEADLQTMARLATAYPDIVRYMLTVGRDEPVSLQGADRIVRMLAAAGLATSPARAFMAINAFATGWAFMRQASVDAARAEGCDALAEAVAAMPDGDDEEVLLQGIRWLVAGMQAERDDQLT